MDPFVSYAQNFEDVMLWRALRHVERGFYIDVGAAEPELESVTCAFYERGWHGMNVEPAAAPFAKLVTARPRDINLNVAAGAASGETEMLLVDGGAGLTTLQTNRLTQLQVNGHRVEPERVAVSRLADLCREHAPKDIHFLKIDVEGFERDVIEGAELETWRPWIIVVEATEPNTTVSSHQGWEPLMLSAGYNVVYTDGLNRFYLAQERDDLAGAFAAPPNVFDRFIRREEWLAKRDAEKLYRQVVELDASLARVAANETRLDERLGHMLAERDTAIQELWESNRLVGVLSGERQSLLDQMFIAEDEHRKLAARIADLRPVQAQQRSDETLTEQLSGGVEERKSLWEQLAAIIEERRSLTERLAAAIEQHQRLEQAKQAALDAKQAALEAERTAQLMIAAMHQSTSWRLTAPLRLLKRPRRTP